MLRITHSNVACAARAHEPASFLDDEQGQNTALVAEQPVEGLKCRAGEDLEHQSTSKVALRGDSR